MAQTANLRVEGNVEGSITVGDNNFVVNANHGTIIYKHSAPQVRLRQFAPQPPRPPRGFIGRSAELLKLAEWIASNEIVLIHAPDGIGKTALLRQAATSEAARAMPNGVILLEPPGFESQPLGADDVCQQLFDALFESDPPLKVDSVTARTYLIRARWLCWMKFRCRRCCGRGNEFIAAELGNFLGALDWAVRTEHFGDVIALARTLAPILCLRGLWDTWGRVLEFALQAALRLSDRAAEAWVLHESGAPMVGMGNLSQANEFFRRALQLRQKIGDEVGQVYTRHNLDVLFPATLPVCAGN